jgi:hypothetical protein
MAEKTPAMKLKKTPILLILIFLQLSACKKDKDNTALPPPEPIAAYDFVGNAKNSISQLHHGTKVGAITNSLDSFATPNAAYFFPGNSYVKIPDSDVLDFAGNQFTITAWIRPVVTTGSYVVHKSASSGNGGMYSLDIHPGLPRSVISTQTDETFVVTGTSSIKKQVWQHLAVTFSGKELVIYYNGEKEGTTAVDRPLKMSTSSLNIGAYESVLPGASFEGTIDNVRIFDKALDANQVKKLYQNYRLYEK